MLTAYPQGPQGKHPRISGQPAPGGATQQAHPVPQGGRQGPDVQPNLGVRPIPLLGRDVVHVDESAGDDQNVLDPGDLQAEAGSDDEDTQSSESTSSDSSCLNKLPARQV